MQQIWDISPPVGPDSPVFPGDSPYRQTWVAEHGPGVPVNVAQISLSPHVGAHADGPLHHSPGGEAIGTIDLHPYLGPCRVVHALNRRPLITRADLAHAWHRLPPRVLVRTYERFPHQAFDAHLTGFDPALVDELAQRGVCLIGTDSASIDPADSKDLPSHGALRRWGLRVLENLCLDDVPEGDYELIALPLRWTFADASPVRAVLRR